MTAQNCIARRSKTYKGFFTGLTGTGGLFNAVDGHNCNNIKTIKTIGKTIGKLFLY